MFGKQYYCLVCNEPLPTFNTYSPTIVKCLTEYCWILWRWTPLNKKLTAIDWPGKRKDGKCGCASCQPK